MLPSRHLPLSICSHPFLPWLPASTLLPIIPHTEARGSCGRHSADRFTPWVSRSVASAPYKRESKALGVVTWSSGVCRPILPTRLPPQPPPPLTDDIRPHPGHACSPGATPGHGFLQHALPLSLHHGRQLWSRTHRLESNNLEKLHSLSQPLLPQL